MRYQHSRLNMRIPATVNGFGVLGSAMLSSGGAACAVSIWDRVRIATTIAPTTVTIRQGEYTRIEGDENLTVRAFRHVIDMIGQPQAGLEIHYGRAIPAYRGLGDSIAQITAGLMAARGFLGNPPELADATMHQLAWDLLDNVAAASAIMRGGVQLALPRGATPEEQALLPAANGGARERWIEIADLRPVQPLVFTLFIPDTEVSSTDLVTAARGATLDLSQVEIANTRAAAYGAKLLNSDADVFSNMTVTDNPGLLEALHPVIPATVEMVQWLRQSQVPAFIAGLGSSVAALGKVNKEIIFAAQNAGWKAGRVTHIPNGAEIVTID
ncbi:hypothetical protein [Boudabousia marimammalium]|uniref:GHMP kinase N-terminal domain-containing protein n=1 Tax=Boudabousia marimammalium TaxID=156892 RepID=A0A1Q5PRV9_9ACTO|nr:hypothetical protein [Boudabousia marimammalium]OKL50175.1 hypothetical protein BM477_01915 [Boudabousia marimammalium]